MENRLNGFSLRWSRRNRYKRFKDISADLNHRAEATVLMRSLRVIQGVARLDSLGGYDQKLCQKTRTFELATQSTLRRHREEPVLEFARH
jgi:hypothetical protein